MVNSLVILNLYLQTKLQTILSLITDVLFWLIN